jgi:hypothetical protein
MLHRKHNHCNLKARKKVLATDLSTVLYGNSHAKASLRVHVIFQVHGIRSTSAQLLARSTSTER